MPTPDSQRIQVARPDSRINEGVMAALLHLVGEIWRFRSHIKTVFKEEFHAASHGTGLGKFWNFLLPIIPLTVYWFLSRLRVFPTFDGVDSATFLTFGVTLWFLFTGCVQIPIRVIQSRNKEAMKTAFPLGASIVTGFAQLAFESLVRIAFVAGVVVVTHSWPTWSVVLLPLIWLPAFLLFVGAGLLLGILNVIYKDVSSVVTILLQYGIFVSGVIFPLNNFDALAAMNVYNPFAVFIDASRSVVFKGTLDNFYPYLGTSALAVLVFLPSCRLFYIMEYRVRGIG